MGQEVQCRVEHGPASSRGKAMLETSEVLFRGDFRLKIPFQQIREMQVDAGKLIIQFPEGTAVFHLGGAAEKWAARIRNPPRRLDKLGVKPGTKVKLIGKQDDDFRQELSQRGAVVTRAKPELAFLAAQEKDDLVELAYLAEAPVWVIYPKGIQAIRESDVRTAGLAAGMVDIKVCAFSATHTALKFTPRSTKVKKGQAATRSSR